ncbi:DUF6531 domain-containing protein [Cupriavidus basilensis]|uniref:DUF6531 domain-containing protein n=1 Tax=Cupriavidus basilensis TaxID=68895 RepID=A0ABT6AUB8_9BURK|nr:DUF6531 domain-containing protein [Cupriavidus basilensis]MDF3836224.1 DUF6531 domain-containing protein [Cupriavidus basilensis]
MEEQCPDLPQQTANACPVGNPISPLTGQKVQVESPDFQSSGPHPLTFQRTYRSDTAQYGSNVGSISNTWFHNWQRALNPMLANEGTIMARREDASLVRFFQRGQQWLQADGQSRDYILAGPDDKGVGAWQYHAASTDTVEAYDANGRLLTVTERNGWTTTLAYTTSVTAAAPWGRSGVLESVQNQFGARLSFAYDASNNLISVITPDGATIRYGLTNDGGTTVTWPDGSMRRYHYGEDIPNFQTYMPGRLTGITDELGNRFSRYNYSTSTGFVTSEEHTGGVDKLSFSYSANSTLVTDGNALTRTFNYQLAGTLRQPTGGSGFSPIGDPFNTIQYDSSNNVSRTVDRNGSDTRYAYDAQGREIQRIEGYGTADAKTTTTEWHPTWNLPAKVAAPGRLDSFDYDAKGQVISYAWYPTADSNGSQGTSAKPAGAIARSAWSYNSLGLLASTVETIDGNAAGRWAFTYDQQGNLASVTTPEGKKGRALRYDPAGRVLEVIDADGNSQLYEYNSRGQIVRYDVGGKTVTYEYNALGFLTAVRGPESSYIGYEYDEAHHLKAFLLQPAATEAVSTISPFSSVQTTADSSSMGKVSVWRRVWTWIKSWLGRMVGNAHAQSSVQRIPVPQSPAQVAGCDGTGCQQTFMDCLANCIRAYDPLSDEFKIALTGLGGTFPKAMVGLPRGLGGAKSVTAVPSVVAHSLGGGKAGTAGGATRLVGRIASPIWIGYGVYLAGMEGYCAANCGMNSRSH